MHKSLLNAWLQIISFARYQIVFQSELNFYTLHFDQVPIHVAFRDIKFYFVNVATLYECSN